MGLCRRFDREILRTQTLLAAPNGLVLRVRCGAISNEGLVRRATLQTNASLELTVTAVTVEAMLQSSYGGNE